MNKTEIPLHSSLVLGKNSVPKDATGDWVVRSPARNDHTLGRCQYSYSQIDQIVTVASSAYSKWNLFSFAERKGLVLKSFSILLENKNEWNKIAQEELGRSSEDLELEWNRLESWMQTFGVFNPSLLDGHGESRGVTVVIGSFVWPLFHSCTHAFLNLLAGNTVILKPSEKATLSVLRLAECLTRVPEIAAALQVLVGEKEVGRRLVCHDQVQTVVFMGSFEVGLRVKQDTLSQISKQVLLYLSAKNPSILCEDFPAGASQSLIRDCFLSTGQHCRSVSMVLVHHSRFKGFVEEFHEAAKAFKIGSPMSGAWAGPLIDPSMLDRYLKFSGISEREGAEVIMRGKPLALEEKGNYITPTLAVFESLTPDQMKKSVSLQTEILAPHVSVIQYRDYDEMSEVCAQIQHGFCASVWGENRARVEKIASRLGFGQVLLNQGLLDWNPGVSFQARKRSGNHASHGFKLWEMLTTLKQING